MDEIKAILKKNDIAGFVVIHTPGHVEFLNKINPSYSCANLQDGRLDMKSKKENYKNQSEQMQHLKNTSDMLYGMSKQIGIHAMLYLDASQKLDKHLNVDHTDHGTTSHESQNN